MESGLIIPCRIRSRQRANSGRFAAGHNDHIAHIVDHLADLLEIDEANPFRVRA
ncbi:MAG: hypothetical protein ACI915_005186 [Gammaproteobacteria bacterium]|jgi:hypothetical protein